MNGEPVFSRPLLMGWLAAAIALFAVSLYLLGAGEGGRDPDNIGPNTYSRSAIGHAGIAEVLARLGIPVVKSRYNSLEKLSPGGVLVIAEPRPGRQAEEAIRPLVKAAALLLVLPKRTGLPSEHTPGWLREAREGLIGDAQWALKLVAPRAEVVREASEPSWTTNPLGAVPSLAAPYQLVRGGGLRTIIGSDRGALVAEIDDTGRKVLVLSDPDVIANHGLAREGNAALAAALIRRLRAADGNVVFDETVHGLLAAPSNPLVLMFRFPFVIATAQGLIAVALLLWASLVRFGAPQSLPAPLSAGRASLLQNMAKLIEFTGHQQVMVDRYVQETVRDVARQLHAPRELAGGELIAWLQRVGRARGVAVDCGALMRQAVAPGAGRRRDWSSLARLARDAHRWKGEILDGSARHPRDS